MEQHQIQSYNVSRGTFSSIDKLIKKYRTPLEIYLDQLLWWNKKINLVSRDVSRGTVWEHIRHSMILTQFEIYQEAEFIVDAGTGGGLPGIPLAISSPKKHFLLNDIVSKKTIAIRQILLKLGLENASAEAIAVKKLKIPASSLLISKHAFKINELWEMVKNKPWNSMAFYKGTDFENELEGIDTPLNIDCFELSEESDFYKGKALLIINRI